jgi:hypothetical protein
LAVFRFHLRRNQNDWLLVRWCVDLTSVAR